MSGAFSKIAALIGVFVGPVTAQDGTETFGCQMVGEGNPTLLTVTNVNQHWQIVRHFFNRSIHDIDFDCKDSKLDWSDKDNKTHHLNLTHCKFSNRGSFQVDQDLNFEKNEISFRSFTAEVTDSESSKKVTLENCFARKQEYMCTFQNVPPYGGANHDSGLPLPPPNEPAFADIHLQINHENVAHLPKGHWAAKVEWPGGDDGCDLAWPLMGGKPLPTQGWKTLKRTFCPPKDIKFHGDEWQFFLDIFVQSPEEGDEQGGEQRSIRLELCTKVDDVEQKLRIYH
jgi:hypothetical protein